MMSGVNTLIVIVAQYLAYAVVLAAVVVWLLLGNADKVALAAQAIFALVLALIGIKIAGAIHYDPRPFVVNPGLTPLFHHAPDNGFPSDHTTFAVTIALLVLAYRRVVGTVLLVVALAIGAARVAAHVHHVQDVITGALIGLLAVLIAVGLWRLVAPSLTRRFAILQPATASGRHSAVGDG